MRIRPKICAASVSLTVVLLAQSPDSANLDPDKFDLESLMTMRVTTASKFPQKLSEAPGVMSVITEDELRRFGAITVGEALERVPGLMSTASYLTDPGYAVVRGDSVKDNGSHTLVLINGRPTREAQEGGTISDILLSFPVNALERIEVIRGPGSVLYGTNAFSGVINLITKRDQATSATLRGYGSGPGAGGGSAEVAMSKGRFQLMAAGQSRIEPTRRSGFLSPFAGLWGLSQEPGRRYPKIEEGTGAFLNASYRGLRFMGAYTHGMATSYAIGVGESRQSRGFTNIGYTVSPRSNWQINFDLTRTESRFRAVQAPWISRASSDSVAEWSNSIQLGGRDQLTVGGLLHYIEGTELFHNAPSPIPISVGARGGSALYAQAEHRLSETVKVIGGFQSNKAGAFRLDTVPRGGLIWSLNRKVHFKALYGRAFRAPSINELYIKFPGLSGNLALGPEHVGTLDFNASYQTDRLLLAVTYYESRQSGVIQVGYESEFGQEDGRYQNLERVHGSGLEAEAKQYLTDRFFWSGTFLYLNHLHGRSADAGHIEGASPKWLSSASLSYQQRRAYTASLMGVVRPAIETEPLLNPRAGASLHINAHGRLEFSRLIGEAGRGFAFFVHGVNLANQKAWVPSWPVAVGTVPFRGGRALHYGLEVALSRD